MTTPDQQLENAIVAAGANVAPRITPADIEANIVSEHYFTADDGVVGAALNAGGGAAEVDDSLALALARVRSMGGEVSNAPRAEMAGV